jgi:hypothetical protein
MTYAPVALFVYNRPRHTRQTVEALLANAEASESLLYIFSDAPKDAAASKAVAEVREYVKNISGFKSVSIIERESNFGLARSIIDGVSSVCNEHGRVVVLEDDIVVSRYFLKFMNDALAFYEHDERVISIGGYQYPVKATLPETFFLKCADCWGWATWKRGWDLFEADGRVLLQDLTQRKLTRHFDFDGSYPYTRMLRNQIKGRNNSWAIRWYASAFLNDKLTLYPGRSLVLNIGYDGSGTHCTPTNTFKSDISDIPVKVEMTAVEENSFARRQHVRLYRIGWLQMPVKIMRKLTHMVRQAMCKNGARS